MIIPILIALSFLVVYEAPTPIKGDCIKWDVKTVRRGTRGQATCLERM
jgi:hypothetical protein